MINKSNTNGDTTFSTIAHLFKKSHKALLLALGNLTLTMTFKVKLEVGLVKCSITFCVEYNLLLLLGTNSKARVGLHKVLQISVKKYRYLCFTINLLKSNDKCDFFT